MIGSVLAPLLSTLRPHFDPGKTRLETLAVMIVGLVNSRTVNLSHLASQFPGPALHASNYRRLQRFFQFVHLDGDIAARLIVRMLNLGRPKLLALDRTNWKLGRRDVNVLVLAIVTRRFRVPLMWTLLVLQLLAYPQLAYWRAALSGAEAFEATYTVQQVPGLTPYTKNSELQNAETSAWGRALVAVLAADTKEGVASADEVLQI